MILVLGKTGYVSKRFQDFFQYKNIDHQVISLRDLKMYVQSIGYKNSKVNNKKDKKEIYNEILSQYKNKIDNDNFENIPNNRL